MERKELKIEIPQGYEIDKEKSTFEKIVFKKVNSLSKLPKTWEEYCKYTKGCPSFYYNYNREPHIRTSSFDGCYSEFSTKERVNQFVAFGKLLQLRDYWVRGYKEFKYALLVTKNGDIIAYDWSGYPTYPHILTLTFPTKEMVEEFKECFSDLIKKVFLPD